MPKSFLRFLVVTLLAVMIPLQGAAAVAAGQCMSLGHHHDASPGHSHDSDDSHDHAGHSHADDGMAQDGDERSQNAHCGPCAACCASASIAGPARLSILSTPSSAKHVFSQFTPPSVQLDALDRPPLSL